MAQNALEQIAELKNLVKNEQLPENWKQKEDQFKALIEKFTKEPKLEPNENDRSLFKEISDLYVTTGNGFYYKKIMELMNVFLLKTMNEAVQTYKDTNKIFKHGWIHKYPFAKQIFRDIEAIRRKNVGQYHEVYHEQTRNMEKIIVGNAKFQAKKLGKELSTKEIESAKKLSLSFMQKISHSLVEQVYHPKPVPEVESQSNSYYEEYPFLAKSFPEALNALYEEPRKVLEEDLKKELDDEKEKFRVASHNYAHAVGLVDLMRFYESGIFDFLRMAPHLAYQSGGGSTRTFYPDTARNEILIDSPLETLFNVKLNAIRAEQKSAEEQGRKTTAQASAAQKDKAETNSKDLKVLTPLEKLIAQFPDLKSWTVLPKQTGKDIGFILKSPDGTRKIYSKMPRDYIQYFYVANMLSHLGIKTAEPLITDQLVSTHDLSRRYIKKESKVQKDKTFKTMLELIPSGNQAAWGMTKGERSLASKTDKEELKKFLDTVSADEKARISFAKLVIAAEALNLGDVFAHGNNIGLIETKKGGKKYIKFGIVDFTQGSAQLTGRGSHYSSKDRTTIDNLGMHCTADEGGRPIYHQLFKLLKPEDFKQAALELQNPKLRQLSEEGYRVVTGITGNPLPSALAQNPAMQKQTQNLHDSIQQAFQETVKTIQKTFKGNVNENNVENDLKEIVADHPILEENLNTIIDGVLKETEKKPKHK